MSIKPFNDRFGKVLKVITGSARLLSDQPLSIPNIGKKRDIKFSKAYKTDLLILLCLIAQTMSFILIFQKI